MRHNTSPITHCPHEYDDFEPASPLDAPRPASPSDIFGARVFNDAVMRRVLPRGVYESLRKTVDGGEQLDAKIAQTVAVAMKDWAVANGATHFTHWFTPLSGVSAEKHDAFIAPALFPPNSDGRAIMEFSAKELIRGESDASSFPSGGLRATFEARGYTAWDCTSPAFIKDNSLYIPTVFCSYTGEALDKKTPLLRSMEALNRQALRVLRHLGDAETRRVIPMVGPEQEYFLVDRDLYERRMDLMICGRTLFGCKPVKGQEMDDHYYGRLRMRVSAFMKELDEELWALGVVSKTKHNEAAPAQHELAPLYNTANIAFDQNNLMMDLMRRVAKKHHLACLLHEKPFSGVNGSGKHNNWSLSTDTGRNLLDPGSTPLENMQFILLLCAILRGVDAYAPLLRMAVATYSNDARLGSHEAPPAIVSVYLGEELTEVLDALEHERPAHSKKSGRLALGALTLPSLSKDSTDRNRTSPIAFTGNKLEFRMCGNSASISRPNFILNTIVADQLQTVADELDRADAMGLDKTQIIGDVVRDVVRMHKRVIFNGNNYAASWQDEAAARGLPNIRDSIGAFEYMTAPESVALFERQGVLSRAECESRAEIMYENYLKAANVEAQLMLEMAGRQLIPAAMDYAGKLCADMDAVAAVGLDKMIYAGDAAQLLDLITKAKAAHFVVCVELDKASQRTGIPERATAYRDRVLPAMQELRGACDALEPHVPLDKWPVPSYLDLMYRL